MRTREMDPVFTAALRELLIDTVKDAPRVRRRWRWRLGIGVFTGSTLVAGGVAIAATLATQPGATIATPLGNVVTATRTGSATIDLGPQPANATHVSLTLTCLTAGTFDFPDGSSETCSAADISRAATYRQATEVVPLQPGEHVVAITTSANASWSLQATYVNRVVTSWGRNALGETYGVANRNGTPDLVAVWIDHTAGQWAT
jgi:hypothetical protein